MKPPSSQSALVKLGIITRDEPVYSLQIYRENVERELINLGVEPVPLPTERPDFDQVDLIWDPALISARFPVAGLRTCAKPVVATVHGLASHTLSMREFYPDPLEASVGETFNRQVAREWKWFRKKVDKVIAVSRYGAEEVISIFGVPRKKVIHVYHGVNHKIFHPDGKKHRTDKPYLLQIAQYAAKKNVDRVIEAYTQLPVGNRPDLLAILPNYEGPDPGIPGLRLMRERVANQDLVKYYRGALAFIFPSIHETFGLPILEAMACGCPVITSNVTAIPELTGDAALLVNPRSVEEIYAAMQSLVGDEKLRKTLRDRGLVRVTEFTWERSAREHLEVFQSVL